MRAVFRPWRSRHLVFICGSTVTALSLLVGTLAPTATWGQTPPPAAQSEPPARFLGTVTFDGQPAFEGDGVGAQVNGINCGTTVVSGGTYVLDVAADSQKPGCGTRGARVVFVRLGLGPPGGEQADQTGIWDNTQPTHLTLTFTTPTTLPRTGTAVPADGRLMAGQVVSSVALLLLTLATTGLVLDRRSRSRG